MNYAKIKILEMIKLHLDILKSIIYKIMIFSFLFLYSCKEQKKEKKTIKIVQNENKIPVANNDNLDNFVGHYEYKNNDNSKGWRIVF
ncbi:hypothetical protein D3C85_1142370 [compost metagenome]